MDQELEYIQELTRSLHSFNQNLQQISRNLEQVGSTLQHTDQLADAWLSLWFSATQQQEQIQQSQSQLQLQYSVDNADEPPVEVSCC